METPDEPVEPLPVAPDAEAQLTPSRRRFTIAAIGGVCVVALILIVFLVTRHSSRVDAAYEHCASEDEIAGTEKFQGDPFFDIIDRRINATVAEGEEPSTWVSLFTGEALFQDRPSIWIADDAIIVDGAYRQSDLSPTEAYQGQVVGRIFQCVLYRLDTPADVHERINRTRALDGTQTAEADGVQYTWSFHPDSGVFATIKDS
jgi:hypothetical protein